MPVLALGLFGARASAQCEVQYLTASDGGAGDSFGRAGTLYADTVVVTAQFQDGFGSAYVFEREDLGVPFDPRDDHWSETAKLLPQIAPPNGSFGTAVDFTGDTIAIGATKDDDLGAETGAVFMFLRDNRGTSDRLDDFWLESVKLHASDAGIGDEFGHSLSMWGDTLIVGTRDGERVYVFERDDNGTEFDPLDDSWVESHILRPSDGVGPGIEFGWGLHLRGNTLVIGARKDDDFMSDSGSAYFFERDDKGTPDDRTDDDWVETFKVTASDPSSGVEFGAKVIVDGDMALIGSEEDNDLGGSSGSVYVFARDNAGTLGDPFDDTWIETQKLLGSTESEGDRFGIRIALEGDRAVVGAIDHDFVDTNDGVAYVFERDRMGTLTDPRDDVWAQVAVLHPSLGADQDWFGIGMSLYGTEILIGAPTKDGSMVGPGASIVFSLDRSLACATSRNGTGVNDIVYSSTRLPILGTRWTADVDTSAHPSAFATLLLGYDAILPPTSTQFGELLIGVESGGSTKLLAGIKLSISGLSQHAFMIPNDLSLEGLQVFTQVALIGGGIELGNEIDLILGM